MTDELTRLAQENKQLKEELEEYKSQKIDITKNAKGNEIKNKHAYCIYVPRDDLWVADSYENLLNLNKLQYSEQTLKQKLAKITENIVTFLNYYYPKLNDEWKQDKLKEILGENA